MQQWRLKCITCQIRKSLKFCVEREIEECSKILNWLRCFFFKLKRHLLFFWFLLVFISIKSTPGFLSLLVTVSNVSSIKIQTSCYCGFSNTKHMLDFEFHPSNFFSIQWNWFKKIFNSTCIYCKAEISLFHL